MRCVQVKKLLDEYLDGELSGPPLQDCEAHLQFCTRCRNALADREAVSRALREWEQARGNEDLTARVIKARERLLADPADRWRRFASGLAIIASTAAIAAAIALGTLQFGGLIARNTPDQAAVAPSNELWGQDILFELALVNPQTWHHR
jgi:anti-sigma factor RsiW